MKGIVIKSTGNWYNILAEDGQKINCRIKGRLRIDKYKSTNPIAVGDNVVISLEPDGNGVISEVGKRKNDFLAKR